jgi:RHS repeat-associated protein
VVQRWNPSYSTTPVIGSGVNAGSLTSSKTTDYVGNKVYENGTLKRILTENGYYESGNYYFYVKNHLGSNVITADRNGNIVQNNHYYPFGLTMGISTGPGVQPYKYTGKELDMQHGLNLYDFSARTYDPAIGRFTTPDPLAEKYYPVSPYAYCANNPVNAVDRDGRDVWEINNMGNIINRIEDKTQDAFYMVAQNAEGNYERTFTTDAEGNKNFNSISFEYGTIKSATEATSSLADGSTVNLTMFDVKGSENATELFEFMANPRTTTNVEWSHTIVQDGRSTADIVGTMHSTNNTFQAPYLTIQGRRLVQDTHSHPGGTGPSPADLAMARKLEIRNPGIKLNIYTVPKTYTPYDRNGIIRR